MAMKGVTVRAWGVGYSEADDISLDTPSGGLAMQAFGKDGAPLTEPLHIPESLENPLTVAAASAYVAIKAHVRLRFGS